ncbi:hypothetical protein AWENTII_002580 [Aspergillus wentii]
MPLNFRFDDRRGGESYRPTGRSGRSSSRGYIRHARSPPRNRSPRLVADTWVPSNSRVYDRLRSRSPPAFRRRSRSPSFHNRDACAGTYGRTRSPRRFSPRRDGRARSPLQTSWRPRSPFGDSRTRDASWGRTTPKRLRDQSPPSQDFRFFKRECIASSTCDRYGKPASPSRRNISGENVSHAPLLPRSRSPFQGGRRERYPDTIRRRSPSPSKGNSSVQTSTPGSIANSRRSSPLSHVDRINSQPFDSRSRSPANSSIPHRPFSRPFDRSPPYQERTHPAKYQAFGRDWTRHISPNDEHTVISSGSRRDPESHGVTRSLENQQQMESIQSNVTHASGSTPSQPKAYLLPTQLPPSGPSHGSKSFSSHNRGPNISLLSAPTRPRWASNFRENSWAGGSARRGPVPSAPSGPRGNFTPTGSGVETSRQSVHRQSSVTPTTHPRAPRLTNHLAGLCSIIPGGKFFLSQLEPTMERRLSQLAADQERLFEQIAERQKLKRFGMRDWDKLDRESAISALKSELADGHLQRITDGESVGVGTTF